MKADFCGKRLSVVDISCESRDKEEISVIRSWNPLIYMGHRCTFTGLRVKSHRGAYIETSGHVFRNGKNVHDIPLNRLLLPFSLIRVKTCGKREITASDLERNGAHVRKGDALLVHTACNISKRRSSWPYFSRDAAEWMVSKNIALFGSDTPRYDRGFATGKGLFLVLFKAEVSVIANICSLDKITSKRGWLIALPLSVRNAPTLPCRAIVLF